MMNPEKLHQLYRHTLLDDVIPFWTRYAIDAGGGINTCITDEGEVISRDRWGWSQWRAVWVFAALYNRIEQRSEWLDIARGIHAFVTAHGPLADGHWPLLLDGDGRLLRGFESIYGDGFAIYGLVELWRATGEPRLLETAMATFHAAESTLSGADPPPAWPYPIPAGRLTHGVSMLSSLVYHELAEATHDAEVRAAAERHHRLVLDHFLRPDRGLLLEWLNLSFEEIPPPEGTVVLPGHTIESMWFQIHIARSRGDQSTVDRAVRAIRRHLEIGWDPQYGGLLYAVDADGRSEVAWRFPDAKLWWPHTEALYGTLLAHECSGEPWCLQWHERIREYSYNHFPVPVHGEWRQKLDRRGQPFTDVVALPVKDPFHLPRALILCIEVLERLIAR